PPCSQFAHRRCAYSWTSQHTYVAGMQVRRTTVHTSVPRGTGWSGSSPGIPTRSVRSGLARHEGEELGIEGRSFGGGPAEAADGEHTLAIPVDSEPLLDVDGVDRSGDEGAES